MPINNSTLNIIRIKLTLCGSTPLNRPSNNKNILNERKERNRHLKA